MLISKYIRIGMTYHISGRLDCCSCLPLATASASRFWGQEVGEVLPWGGIAAQLLPSAGLPQFAQFTQSSKFREAGLVCPGRICILGNIRFLEYQYCLPDLPVSIVTMADIWGFQSSAVQCWMLNVCIFRHSEQLMCKNQYCSKGQALEFCICILDIQRQHIAIVRISCNLISDPFP